MYDTDTYIGIRNVHLYQKRTSDPHRTKQDTETTPHHSATLNTETPLNSAYLDPQRQQHRTLYFLAHFLYALAAVQQLK